MPNVVVVIDEQNDFIDGRLGSLEAVEAVNKTKQLLQYVSQDRRRDWKIIFTRDTHLSDFDKTREGSIFPSHCIAGTDGWEISDKLSDFVRDNNVFNKFSFGSMEVCNRAFGFTHCDCDVVFVGLCTDICVIANVLMFTSMYPNTNVSVVENCCAGTSKEKHNAAIDVMRSCGVRILRM